MNPHSDVLDVSLIILINRQRLEVFFMCVSDLKHGAFGLIAERELNASQSLDFVGLVPDLLQEHKVEDRSVPELVWAWVLVRPNS